MKTNNLTNPFGVRQIAVLVFVVASLLLLSQPVFAGASPYTLDITENSSTSLTVIFNNTDITASAVALTSSDHWTLTFSQSFEWGSDAFFWDEPGEPNSYNDVQTMRGAPANQLFVISDTSELFTFSRPDGTAAQGLLFNGQAIVNVDITFHDKGDAANGVPENASTLALFSVALVAVGAVRRVIC